MPPEDLRHHRLDAVLVVLPLAFKRISLPQSLVVPTKLHCGAHARPPRGPQQTVGLNCTHIGHRTPRYSGRITRERIPRQFHRGSDVIAATPLFFFSLLRKRRPPVAPSCVVYSCVIYFTYDQSLFNHFLEQGKNIRHHLYLSPHTGNQYCGYDAR